MIWLHTLGDSHSSAQLQGPIGRFSGEFLQLKICFQPGVSCECNNEKHKINKCRICHVYNGIHHCTVDRRLIVKQAKWLQSRE